MYRYEDYDYYKNINKKIFSEEYHIYKYFFYLTSIYLLLTIHHTYFLTRMGWIEQPFFHPKRNVLPLDDILILLFIMPTTRIELVTSNYKLPILPTKLNRHKYIIYILKRLLIIIIYQDVILRIFFLSLQSKLIWSLGDSNAHSLRWRPRVLPLN